MASYIVGLTGGIGSGKSAAADRFIHHGVVVVDADASSRAVVEPGSEALTAIAEHFGADILQSDGSLDRAALRVRVFANVDDKRWLERLLHPLISRHMRRSLAEADSPYAILMNPLLIETGNQQACRRIFVIDVQPEVQLERTMARDGNTRQQVERILQAQADRDTRLSAADDVLVNDRDLPSLHLGVDRLHQKYLSLAADGEQKN